ncbi:Hypothetical predicted protein, partial [Paramuricea clavata]
VHHVPQLHVEMEGNVKRKDVLSSVLVFLDLKGKYARERVHHVPQLHVEMEGNVQRKDILSNVLVFLDLKGKDARERHEGVSSDEATDTDILVANFSEILSDTSQKVLNIKRQKKKIKKGTNDSLDRPVSLEEVYKLSKRLKNKKASANNSLSNEIIKLAVEVLPSYFEKLFNKI